MSELSVENDAPKFRAVSVSWCASANAAHLRYSVVWPDGTKDGWCAGHAPLHIGARMREQLRAARSGVISPGERKADA